MQKNKSYLIQVPDGTKLIAEFLKTEKDFHVLKFRKCDWPIYSNRTKKILRFRFESGFACLEGTDHLILEEIK
jgi:hypothetical protein